MTKKRQDETAQQTQIERRDDDQLWKILIERFFWHMLERAIPTLHEDADREKKPAFLDKELHKATHRIKGKANVVDFLISVPMKNGGRKMVFLHIEVQGRGGGDLTARMYHYKSLIYVQHRQEPVALAIITDKRPTGEAESYASAQYGTSAAYIYNRLVLSELDDEDLLASGNPFDLALYAAKLAVQSRHDERRKHAYLKELLRLLSERGWHHDDTHDLLMFIEKIIHLCDETLKCDIIEYEKELAKEADIVLMTYIEEAAMKEGLEKGREEGIEKGLKKGRLEGLREGLLKTARAMLARGFDPKDITDLTGLPEDEIRKLAH